MATDPETNRNIIIGIAITAFLVLTAIIGWIFLSGENRFVPQEEIIEEEEGIELLLEELTPDNDRPLTPEEDEELKELLKQLTP